MKYFLAFMLLFGANVSFALEDGYPEEQLEEEVVMEDENGVVTLRPNSPLRITVTGMGVAPTFTTSPAQAYAMAKRSATVEGYRLIAERVNGVKIQGQDTIQNMMVKRSTIRTGVSAMIRNAQVVETTFKDGMCEVEMEVVLNHSQFN